MCARILGSCHDIKKQVKYVNGDDFLNPLVVADLLMMVIVILMTMVTSIHQLSPSWSTKFFPPEPFILQPTDSLPLEMEVTMMVTIPPCSLLTYSHHMVGFCHGGNMPASHIHDDDDDDDH